MGGKAEETTRNINNAFGPVTANECTEQWWCKKFCKEHESMEDEACMAQSSEADNDQFRAIIRAGLLTATQEVAKELNVNHSTVIWHLKQIGKVKKVDKWVPHELTEKQKKIDVLKCHFLLFYAITANHFSIGLWYAMKSGFYMTTGNDQLSTWTEKKSKALPKAKLAPRKGHGHCLVVYCPSDPLQLSESH